MYKEGFDGVQRETVAKAEPENVSAFPPFFVGEGLRSRCEQVGVCGWYFPVVEE